MFPYHDENQTQRLAVVTLGIIAACVLTWLLVQGAGLEAPLEASVCNLGLVASQITGLTPAAGAYLMGEGATCYPTAGLGLAHLITHMFLHGSWMHLLGNMWFLWLFGNNIEDSMTRPRFIVFYLLCGLAAASLQIYSNPSSVVPMVGASGAISGVMGAYLILFPRVRVFTILFLGFFITRVTLPAWGVLIYWAVLQLGGGLVAAGGGDGGGVAFWAHVGGFLAGIVLVKLFVKHDLLAAHKAIPWRPGQAA